MTAVLNNEGERNEKRGVLRFIRISLTYGVIGTLIAMTLTSWWELKEARRDLNKAIERIETLEKSMPRGSD